jgi:four helix bundle protein
MINERLTPHFIPFRKLIFQHMKRETESEIQRPNLILDLSFAFSLKIIEFVEELEMKGKQTVAKQLLRSGTSIGANISEAQGAESKQDFIHKLKISFKEINETGYWLKLCKDANSYPTPGMDLFTDLESISKITSKIISTTRQNLGK